MSIEQGSSPKEIGIKQEKKEGETGLGDLLELAQDIQAEKEKETAQEQVELKTAELRAGEAEKKSKQNQLEKATDFALASGRAHYQELTTPKAFEEARQAARDERIEIIRKKGYGSKEAEEFEFQHPYWSDTNSIRQGRMDNHFPDLRGWVEVKPPRTAEEYLPNISQAMNDIVERGNGFRNERIQKRKAGKLSYFFGELKWYDDPSSTPEKIKADVEQLQKEIEEYAREGQLSVQKHAEGFGRAALEAGDVAVAMDNLDAAGILENPEIIAALKTRMIELKASEKPEDKLKLRKASEKLLAIQARKTAEQKK